MTTQTDISIHHVDSIELMQELLGPLGVSIDIAIGETDLGLYFARSRAGLAAWQQVRQGLARSDDYVLVVNGERIEAGLAEHAALEWLASRVNATLAGA